jgi:hypothetical protein
MVDDQPHVLCGDDTLHVDRARFPVDRDFGGDRAVRADVESYGDGARLRLLKHGIAQVAPTSVRS